MTTTRRRTALGVGAVVVLGAAVVAAVALGGGATSPTRAAATVSTTTGWLGTTAVQQFASEDSVGNLSVLVSAGSGTNGIAVVTGTNTAGENCWTLVQFGGAVGSPFRCGTAVGTGVGDPRDNELRVVCQTSGAPGSSTADSAGCLGFVVGANVSSVAVKLNDGSMQPVTVKSGAFVYAASTADQLPAAFTASDASGQAVDQQSVSLAKGNTG